MNAQKPESAWRRWRHTRPFWGGLLVIISGAEILATVKAPLPVILHVGMQGLAGYLVPIVILLCGILLLVNPSQRLFYSIVAAVLTLASWATSNLGGFIIGLILGLVGSALAFAWAPRRAAATPAAPAATEAAEPIDAAPTEAGAEAPTQVSPAPVGRHADIGLAITRHSTDRDLADRDMARRDPADRHPADSTARWASRRD